MSVKNEFSDIEEPNELKPQSDQAEINDFNKKQEEIEIDLKLLKAT